MRLFETIPDVLKPFRSAGRVSDIFSPRMLPNGIFATKTGYGVSFSLSGLDSEGLDRETLDYASRHIATATRALPDDCRVYEYLVVANADPIPARNIDSPLVRCQALERADFLTENAKFRSVRLIVTLYIAGKVEKDADEFTAVSRAILKSLQSAALLYEQQLRAFYIRRLTSDQLVQFYSYLLNLDRSLITRTAAKPGTPEKQLGRVHIGMDGDYLRVGKRFCQILSLVEPPRGTCPNLWGELLAIDCEMVWCSTWQRSNIIETRKKALAVENAVGMALGDVFSGFVGGFNPNIPPPRKATAIAQEKQVEAVGGILEDLDQKHYYGRWSLFGIVHSRDTKQVDAALPRIQNVFSDPAEAGLMEEKRGAVAAYLSCFPGQPYNVRRKWLRGDHKANLSFAYAPFGGFPYSEDFRDEYTLVYETRQGIPFFFTPFHNGNGNTMILGGPGRGKSLNTNAIFTAAMKHGTKTFIFDQGGSYEQNVKALGGSVTYLGLDYPRLNLFAVAPTRENIFAISQIIRLMLNKSGVAVGNDDQDSIEKGVERVFDMPASLRRLKHLILPPSIRNGLKRWCEGGMYGNIFDNIEDDLRFHDLQLFDFASLGEKHSDLLEVQMSWILMLCQGLIRDKVNLGTPKHIVMDELWKRMGVLPVLAFVLETIKADRKNLAWATLVTQSLQDLGQHAQIIKDACPNALFLGGAFNRELYEKHFRLNAKELDELEGLGERELAIKVDGEPFISGGTGYFKILRLNLDPAAYTRATTKPAERAMRERLMAEHGEVEGMRRMKEIAAAYRSA